MSDRKPPPVSRFWSTLMRRLILLVVYAFVMYAQFGLARTISIEVAADGWDGDGYWVGLFDQPITKNSLPKYWQFSDNTETTLQARDQEDLVLVALQKGSVPLYQRIEPSSNETLVELQFKKGRLLRGEVLSTDGFQIEDATFSVHRLDGLQLHQYPDETIASWQSDKHGEFSISGLEVGTYEIRVVPRIGLPEELLELVIYEEESETTVENLQLQNTYFISGEVRNEEDELIEGAEVIATEWNDGLVSIQTSTAETGKFRVGPFVKDESIWVEAQVSDQYFSEVQKVKSGRADLKLIVRKLLNVKGTVIERETGNLVEEFTVSALSGLGPTRMARWTNEYTFDGSKGHFSVEVDWRISHVIIEAPGFDFCFIPIIVTTEDVHDVGIIELDGGRVVNGTVVDAATGHPVVGAEVRRTEWDQVNDEFAVFTFERREPTITNEMGQFTLSPIPVDKATIEVSAEGYFRSETSLSKDQDSIEIELRKRLHPTIFGSVQSYEGLPLKATLSFRKVDSPLWMGWGNQPTHLDGTFELLADDGTYELYATKSGFNSSITETVVVEDQTPVDDLILLINTSGNSISGNVTGLEETESLTIRVTSTHEEKERGAYVRGNESYSVGGLPDGKIRVEATSSLRRTLTKEILLEGNNRSAIVNLAFDGRSSLSGLVTAGGKPVGNVRISATPTTKGHVGGETNSQKDGSYSIENLVDGEYEIQTNRGLSFDVVLTGDTFFDIEVGSLSVGGTVVTALPTQDMVVVLKSDSDESIRVTARVDSKGAFHIDGLQAGSYTIRVTRPGRVTPNYAKSTYSLNLEHSIEDFQIELPSD